MYYNETCKDRMGFADVLNYASQNNTTATSLGIDMSKFKRAIFIVSCWTTTAGTGTLDGRLQGSANANFTGNTNISGTNLTQLTANNTFTTTEIRADQLTQANSTYKYVRLHITTATNAVTCSAIGIGVDSVQNPGSQYNLNSTFLATQVVCTL